MRQIDIIKMYAAKKCLVIDDFPEMRGFIRQAVMVFGADSVDTAANGEEALKQCERNDYDIIFADYNLGDASKNGQQILEELRYKNALKNTSLYIMITAEATRDMVFSALEYQPDGYITKPFTQNALRSRLDRIMLEKESIREINQATDNEQYGKGIQLCIKQLGEGSKYKSLLNRKLAGLYVSTQRYSDACVLYKQVIAERPIEWATIGLGKVLLLQGELDSAEVIFRKLIADNCNCMEVYDCLAEILQQKEKNQEALEVVEQALDISPLTILRQQSYADLSERCGDMDKAVKAHRSVVKLSPHSCYEEPENYLGYARSISSQMEKTGTHDKKQLDEATTTLKKLGRRYPNDSQVALQAILVETQVYASSSQREKAQQTMDKADSLYQKIVFDPGQQASPELMLEVAKSMLALGENDQAQGILKEIATLSACDARMAEKLDMLSDEPISKAGKSKAIKLNKEGKILFDAKNYKQAADFFSRGLDIFPNNIALNINMVFALIKDRGGNGLDSEAENFCRSSLKKIDHIPEDHRLFGHYQKLKNKISNL
ncbi:MAG: response regulator [Pseudomonadales bacterium]|nr:response regulator [Pseudomonadales bacterium]